MNTEALEQGHPRRVVPLALAAALTMAMVATQLVAPVAHDTAATSEPSVTGTIETLVAAQMADAATVTAPMAAAKDVDAQTAQVSAAIAKMSAPVAEYARAGGARPVQIIVRVDDAAALDAESLQRLGGEIVRRFDRLGLVAINVPAGALVELAIADNVRRVSLDAPIQSTATLTLVREPTNTLTVKYDKLDYMRAQMPVHLQAINAPVPGTYNDGFAGEHLGVAVVDSGVVVHDDLHGRVRQYDFTNGRYPQPEIDNGALEEYNSNSRVDHYGHGTLVAGAIAGNGHNSNASKYAGMARRANVVSLRVLDANGQGVTSDAIAAMDWLVQYGHYFKIKVANLSIGKAVEESVDTDPLVLAVEAAWDAGIAVVVAAGNHGRDGNFTVTSPGNSPKVITVGSITDNGTADVSDDFVSTYSSRGPSLGDHYLKPDLVAPGNQLVSTVPSGAALKGLLPLNVRACDASTCTGEYLEMSGTSMAAPLVAGTVLKMYEKHNGMTPDIAKARLMRTARKFDVDATATGAGVLDVEAAMNDLGVPANAALSPKMARATNANAVAIQNTGVLWGGAEWSNAHIWADGYLWSDSGVDAMGFLWGDETTAQGFLWSDETGAYGSLWTDETGAHGFLWSDEGVGSKGYLWTQGYLWTEVVTDVDPLIDLAGTVVLKDD